MILQTVGLKGELKAGEPLVLNSLASSLGASRTPVREAVVRLLNSGLVTETPHGLAVRRLTENEILEVYELRIRLEALAARLAASNRTSGQLTQIQAIHEAFGSAVGKAKSPAFLARMNLTLHRAICEAARNALLSEFLGRIRDILAGFGSTTFSRPGRARETVDEHRVLVSAIVARDHEAAEEAASRHMSRAIEIRLALYREAQVAGLT
jgi:DNA-binding GntR family transcriptional regulator